MHHLHSACRCGIIDCSLESNVRIAFQNRMTSLYSLCEPNNIALSLEEVMLALSSKMDTFFALHSNLLWFKVEEVVVAWE